MWNAKQRKDIQKWLNPSVHCANLHCLRHETNLEVLSMIEDIRNIKNPLLKKTNSLHLIQGNFTGTKQYSKIKMTYFSKQ